MSVRTGGTYGTAGQLVVRGRISVLKVELTTDSKQGRISEICLVKSRYCLGSIIIHPLVFLTICILAETPEFVICKTSDVPLITGKSPYSPVYTDMTLNKQY